MTISKIHKNVKTPTNQIKKFVSEISIMKNAFDCSHPKASNLYKAFKQALKILKEHGYEIFYNSERDNYKITKEGNLYNYFHN